MAGESSESLFNEWVQDSIMNPEKVYRAAFVVGILFFTVMALFPFYWLLVLALTPAELIVDMGLTPRGFNVYAFVEVFNHIPFHVYIFNSIVIATVTTVIVLMIGSLAGYVFGRLDFPGQGLLLLLILIVSYFPPAAFLLPLFRLFTGNTSIFGLSSPNLFNTPWPMVLPFSAIFMPLAIFILISFYSQIPDGLEDAARVEGATRIQALRKVIMPLSTPGVVTAGLLTFISVYNEFFFSFLMNDGQAQNWAPIVGGIMRFQGEYSDLYNLMAAASIIGILPVTILVLVGQERIVSGLTRGGLKE